MNGEDELGSKKPKRIDGVAEKGRGKGTKGEPLEKLQTRQRTMQGRWKASAAQLHRCVLTSKEGGGRKKSIKHIFRRNTTNKSSPRDPRIKRVLARRPVVWSLGSGDLLVLGLGLGPWNMPSCRLGLSLLFIVLGTLYPVTRLLLSPLHS